tara:strand:+ start:3014 stop:3187 length:174 start_codon:yes stop_codon:yes gene_type:complete
MDVGMNDYIGFVVVPGAVIGNTGDPTWFGQLEVLLVSRVKVVSVEEQTSRLQILQKS